jgi:hypothetical protein
MYPAASLIALQHFIGSLVALSLLSGREISEKFPAS